MIQFVNVTVQICALIFFLQAADRTSIKGCGVAVDAEQELTEGLAVGSVGCRPRASIVAVVCRPR